MRQFLPQVINAEGYITVNRYLQIKDSVYAVGDDVPYDNVYAVGDVRTSFDNRKYELILSER